MSHANARTTVHGRLLIVQRHQGGMPKSHIAKAMGISRKCVANWIKRYDTEGLEGLRERSSRPHHMPRRTSPELEAKVVSAREIHRRGQDWLGLELSMSARTVSRVLRRHQLPYLCDIDPMTGEPIKSAEKAMRYERERPGELVHMDVKKLGRIPPGGGWMVLGHQRHDGPRPKTKVGFDYVHTLIDDHTRLAYSEVLENETAETCAAFLLRAAEDFAGRGIPIIERLMTDNAMAYKSKALAEVCIRLEITHKYIKPHCPWTNGKVERFNRTLQSEWAYARTYLSNDERTAALAPWLHHYNTERRHMSLDGQPPTSRL